MNRPRPRADRSTRGRAFTLLELMVVLAIVGMLAGVAVPRYANMVANRRAEAVVRRVIADFALAQRHARLSGADQTVSFKATMDAYVLVGMPHLDHPSQNYSVDLSGEPYLADVIQADFEGDELITFDAYGVPDSGGSVVIQIGNSWKSISVDKVTGKASGSDIEPIVVVEPEELPELPVLD